MKELNGRAEKTKRDILIGKLLDIIGEKRTYELLKDCEKPFKQIDGHYSKTLKTD